MVRIRRWRQRLIASYNRYSPSDVAPTVDVLEVLGKGFFDEIFGKRPHKLAWKAPIAEDWVRGSLDLMWNIEPDRVFATTPTGKRRLVPGESLVERAGEQRVVALDVHTDVVFAEELRSAFAAFFRCPATTELHVAGPGEVPQPERHDAHHGFVWQLAGKQEFVLGPAKVPYPHRRFDHGVRGEHADQQVTLQAGDVLYLPAGVRYRSRCEDETSVSLHMGIHVPRILDAVESMVERSGFHDASLRAPAPFDVGPDGVRYTLAASDVSRYFHNMANSVGPSEVILRDGSALRISPSTAELEGE